MSNYWTVTRRQTEKKREKSCLTSSYRTETWELNKYLHFFFISDPLRINDTYRESDKRINVRNKKFVLNVENLQSGPDGTFGLILEANSNLIKLNYTRGTAACNQKRKKLARNQSSRRNKDNYFSEMWVQWRLFKWNTIRRIIFLKFLFTKPSIQVMLI